jgi:hypothetical protein
MQAQSVIEAVKCLAIISLSEQLNAVLVEDAPALVVGRDTAGEACE